MRWLNIWWRLWFPLKRRAWQVLLEEEVWQQFRLLWMREFASCCISRVLMTQWQFSRRCRGWMSSWLTWISLRFQFLGELVSRLCRCILRMTRLFSSFLRFLAFWLLVYSFLGSLVAFLFYFFIIFYSY